MNVVFSKEALDDLDRIAAAIAENSPKFQSPAMLQFHDMARPILAGDDRPHREASKPRAGD